MSIQIKPRMVYEAQIPLVGLSMLGDSQTDIPMLWQRFDLLEPRIATAIRKTRYVIITWSGQAGTHSLYVGVAVWRLKTPPFGSVVKILPAARYASFTTPAREMEAAWNYILEEWLPASAYRTPGYLVQAFGREEYMEAPEESRRMRILVPLKGPPRKGAGARGARPLREPEP